MQFTIDNTTYSLHITNGENIKLYRVPNGYSPDGIYLAQWKYGEIESFPACLGPNAHLIADGRIIKDRDENAPLKFVGQILEEGVTIDANS